MTEQDMRRIIVLLRGAWPDQAVLDATILAYHGALAELDAGAVEQAARELIRSSRFFPRPAELRERALALAPAFTGQSRIRLGPCSRCGQEADAIISGKRYCGDHADEILVDMGILEPAERTEATA